jgi:hypothetical protein
MSSLGSRSARQRQQPRRKLRPQALLLARLEARMQGRQLHRNRRTVENRVHMRRAERLGRFADGIDRRHVALKIALGVLLRPCRLTQHIV